MLSGLDIGVILEFGQSLMCMCIQSVCASSYLKAGHRIVGGMGHWLHDRLLWRNVWQAQHCKVVNSLAVHNNVDARVVMTILVYLESNGVTIILVTFISITTFLHVHFHKTFKLNAPMNIDTLHVLHFFVLWDHSIILSLIYFVQSTVKMYFMYSSSYKVICC